MNRLLPFVVCLAACSAFDVAESSGDGGASSSGGAGAEPTVLATGLSTVYDVQANAGGVYWVSTVPIPAGNQGRLHRCDLGGCGGSPALLLETHVLQAAVDPSTVFFTSPTALFSCASGPTCAPKALAADVGDVVAADGGLYLVSNQPQGSVLRRCTPDACGTPTILWSGTGIGPVAVSANGDVYFTTGIPSTELQRWRAGSVTSIGRLPGLPTSMTVAGSHVYFVSRNVLHHCDAATSCTPVPLNASESSVYMAYAHGDAVYYSVFGSGGVPGSIQRCPLDSCPSPTVLARGGNPQSLTIHDGWLYYADNADGKDGSSAIKRVPLQ